MRSMLRVVSAGALALALCGNGQSAAEPGVAGLGECFKAESAVVPFSGVVLARHGAQEYFTAAGVMDVQGNQPITRATRFRLASVGKVFTAAAIGRLVMQGKLQLSDPARKYVPELPESFAAVTIDQLLHHRSGVNSLTRMNPDDMAVIRGARTAHDLLPVITAAPLAFTPGERQEYSNGGYFLLGMVIESLSGKSYADYMAEAVFKPLGMSATGMAADPANTAVPTTRMGMAPGQPAAEPRSLRGQLAVFGSPAGDAMSNADDMMRFGTALAGHQFLSDAGKAAIFPKMGEVWKIGQAGGNVGTNADFAVFPASGDVLVVLANFDPPAGELMGETLRGSLLGKGCQVLRPEDRPSPFKMVIMPPPGGPRPPVEN